LLGIKDKPRWAVRRLFDVPGLGRSLIVIGGLLVVIGVVILLAPRVPWLGRLPGDISIERPNFRFYFPLGTSIAVSIILTLLLNLLIRIFRR
jgi:hypothetical protein